MNKLNYLGIGPKIAAVLLPWLAISIVLSKVYKPLFAFTTTATYLVLYAGTALMVVGLIFYGSTVRLLLAGLKETRLMTKGAYGMCQNPLYAALILFVIPALSLLLNSWLVLTTSVVGYLLVKVFIRSEYSELEQFFGDDYRRYKMETPEFFPVPAIFRKKTTNKTKN
jgi:protein-S-isoprenylcysteine O-methyltransferase Ste14